MGPGLFYSASSYSYFQAEILLSFCLMKPVPRQGITWAAEEKCMASAADIVVQNLAVFDHIGHNCHPCTSNSSMQGKRQADTKNGRFVPFACILRMQPALSP